MRVDYSSCSTPAQVLTLLHFNPHHVMEILALPHWERLILGLLTETSATPTSPPPMETVPGEASLDTWVTSVLCSPCGVSSSVKSVLT